jgi:hypothetical protein
MLQPPSGVTIQVRIVMIKNYPKLSEVLSRAN